MIDQAALLAQVVKCRTSVAEVVGSNPTLGTLLHPSLLYYLTFHPQIIAELADLTTDRWAGVEPYRVFRGGDASPQLQGGCDSDHQPVVR